MILTACSQAFPQKARIIVFGRIFNKDVFIDPQFHFELITSDKDDNKFVDYAIAANATYIVSEDKHFDVLKDITFPKLLVIKLKEFLKILNTED